MSITIWGPQLSLEGQSTLGVQPHLKSATLGKQTQYPSARAQSPRGVLPPRQMCPWAKGVHSVLPNTLLSPYTENPHGSPLMVTPLGVLPGRGTQLVAHIWSSGAGEHSHHWMFLPRGPLSELTAFPHGVLPAGDITPHKNSSRYTSYFQGWEGLSLLGPAAPVCALEHQTALYRRYTYSSQTLQKEQDCSSFREVQPLGMYDVQPEKALLLHEPLSIETSTRTWKNTKCSSSRSTELLQTLTRPRHPCP